ncbi:MAG TPA: DUF2382 domain-containing protein [Herpetosiphonaceae bacterium]|nr:DUF2382 domain-containing protein [Herpetosiphonaceae bacterium]
MASELHRIQQGRNVYGSDGDKVGDVAEVGTNYVLVQKGWLFTKDIYIPVSAISSADEDGVYLNIPKDQINSMDWDMAPMEDATTTTYGSSYDTTTASTTGMRDPSATTVTSTNYAATSGVGDTRTTMDSNVVDMGAARTGTRNVDAGEEARIPVVEEELRVGKREVDSGGVRVNTRVEETPVEEQVTLREERVNVERRPVDRPAADVDFDRLQEGTLEVRERREEPVVDKQARVVEEVVVGKEARERTETVQDSVRRTDVDVQETPGGTRSTGYTETGRASTADVSGTGTMSTRRSDDASRAGGSEGVIESTLGDAKSGAERTTGLDLDRSGEVGDRDRRDNF